MDKQKEQADDIVYLLKRNRYFHLLQASDDLCKQFKSDLLDLVNKLDLEKIKELILANKSLKETKLKDKDNLSAFLRWVLRLSKKRSEKTCLVLPLSQKILFSSSKEEEHLTKNNNNEVLLEARLLQFEHDKPALKFSDISPSPNLPKSLFSKQYPRMSAGEHITPANVFSSFAPIYDSSNSKLTKAQILQYKKYKSDSIYDKELLKYEKINPEIVAKDTPPEFTFEIRDTKQKAYDEVQLNTVRLLKLQQYQNWRAKYKLDKPGDEETKLAREISTSLSNIIMNHTKPSELVSEKAAEKSMQKIITKNKIRRGTLENHACPFYSNSLHEGAYPKSAGLVRYEDAIEELLKNKK